MLYTVNIKNYNKDLINKDTASIKLIAPDNLTILPNQVKFIIYADAKYELSQDVIGYVYSNYYTLYAPYKFIWKNNNFFNITIYNNTKDIISINKNDYLATVKFMTIQFFNLMRKHNNSDKGLASAKINIYYA